MKCPVCKDKDLVMADRQGVEIDYCPSCRGIWLDRGELDKLIDRSGEEFTNSAQSKQKRNEHDDYKHHKQPHHYKKKSIWGEIFDF
jgi:uncharacterized protein